MQPRVATMLHRGFSALEPRCEQLVAGGKQPGARVRPHRGQVRHRRPLSRAPLTIGAMSPEPGLDIGDPGLDIPDPGSSTVVTTAPPPAYRLVRMSPGTSRAGNFAQLWCRLTDGTLKGPHDARGRRDCLRASGDN